MNIFIIFADLPNPSFYTPSCKPMH